MPELGIDVQLLSGSITKNEERWRGRGRVKRKDGGAIDRFHTATSVESEPYSEGEFTISSNIPCLSL
jgi:hypothetical protein